MEPGAVRLTVANSDRLREFYERTIGLRPLGGSNEVARLGADGVPVVELAGEPEATPRPPRTTGLFHLAILVPTRLELARALARVIRSGWRLTGASDHLVSEALYLNDPEGNGIEIYRDRPRTEWRYDGGEIQMSTLPLDLDGLVVELGDPETDPEPMAAAGTRIGHVHLNVADIGKAEAFYAGLLGLDVTVRGYPGALFLSSGGYHHHIGVNTWAGEGAPPPPPGSRGLRWYELVVDDVARLDGLEETLRGAGVEIERTEAGLRIPDPAGNGVLVRG
jgi:catechol 2,3-dioxygenase